MNREKSMMGGAKGVMKAGVAGAMLLMLSGTALAQNARSDFEKPLGGSARSFAGGDGVQMFFSQQDGSNKYELSLKNGRATAKVNGEEVPASRLREKDGKYELLSENGDVLTTFNTGAVQMNGGGGGRAWGGSARNLRRMAPEAPQAPEPPVAEEVLKPRVMMGITMSEPSESLREHLGLKEGETVLLDSVADGLPADKAGLKSKDILVEFDGVRPVDEGKVREIMAKKGEGDKVALKVLRKGTEQGFTITLEKVDPSKVRTWVAPQAREGEGFGQNLQNLKGLNAQELQKHLEELRAHGGQNGGEPQFWMKGPEGQWRGLGTGDDKRTAELNAQLDRKMSELDERMARLNAQMAELQKKLDRLNTKP